MIFPILIYKALLYNDKNFLIKIIAQAYLIFKYIIKLYLQLTINKNYYSKFLEIIDRNWLMLYRL